MITTIQLSKETKKILDSLKVHSRESYNELILRIIGGNSPVNANRENLIETIEVLSNPNLMRRLGKSLERIERGDYGTPLEDLEKELGI